MNTHTNLPAVGMESFTAEHSTSERNRGESQRHWPSALAVISFGLVIFVADAFPQTEKSLPSPSALKKMSVEELVDIEVTSVSKRPERLSETASAIQVITQEDIRRSGATRLPEALHLASNLEVAQIDSRQWAISARGFNSTTSNMLVLVDGRTVYTPLFAGVFWDVQDTLLEDIDRIEVISGPGATLWGANAVNGVKIHLVTVENKIRLRITLEVAQAANLTISSKLLRPAEIVTAGKD